MKEVVGGNMKVNKENSPFQQKKQNMPILSDVGEINNRSYKKSVCGN